MADEQVAPRDMNGAPSVPLSAAEASNPQLVRDNGRSVAPTTETYESDSNPESSTPVNDAPAKPQPAVTAARVEDDEPAISDESSSNDFSVDFSPEDRTRMLEEQLNRERAERERMMRAFEQSRQQTSQPAQTQRQQTVDELDALISDDRTDPATRAFLVKQKRMEELLEAQQRHIESLTTRVASEDGNRQKQLAAAQVGSRVDDLIKKHPILSNGSNRNKAAAEKIKQRLVMAAQQGQLSPDQTAEGMLVLLNEYKPFLDANAPKPQRTAKEKVADAAERKAQASASTAATGGTQGISNSQLTPQQRASLNDRRNKRRFSQLIREEAQKLQSEGRLKSIGVLN